MPDAIAIGDLREARRCGESVILTSHTWAGRDNLADLSNGTRGSFGERRNQATRLTDDADLDAADRTADAGALAAQS